MEVISLLGREQNAVYLVRQGDQRYAVKVLTEETVDTQEDVILKSLDHPCIVKCHGRLKVSWNIWDIIVFEYIEGYPLLRLGAGSISFREAELPGKRQSSSVSMNIWD